MRLEAFRIENFRNLALAECERVPDLMVICGGNGCGKSALLNAIMAAKEHAAPYGGFQLDPRCVAADSMSARVYLKVSFSGLERNWYEERRKVACPESDEIVLEIQAGGRGSVPKRSQVVKTLLSWYSREYANSPGFFDYIDAHRIVQKKQLSSWDSTSLSDAQSKHSLGSSGTQKFNATKEYLASLVFGDARRMMAARRAGEPCDVDSLKDIRDFFDVFFAPMRFIDVQIDSSPFKFIIQTTKGQIDVDDLSSGEKEIFSTFVHFHKLKPDNAVILFDEVDAHLHPDLERKYLGVFRKMSEANQIILTTHSPEIMIAAGSESLFSLSKRQGSAGENQLVRVTGSQDLHSTLSEVMGTNGMVSFNKKVVFIEGQESSADRYVYEALLPPTEFDVSFVPAGDSGTNAKLVERVNLLLDSAGTFQEFYAIVDGDMPRPGSPASTDKLFRLPVYHVENFLLAPDKIFAATQSFLKGKIPYASPQDIESELKQLVLEDAHLKCYSRAFFDAEVAKKAKEAWDAVYKRDRSEINEIVFPEFSSIEASALTRLQAAVADGTWPKVCKGRDLLKAFCRKNGFNYEHFRNSLIERFDEAPPELLEIFQKIFDDQRSEVKHAVAADS